ncbi:MAG TPA: hypothetical protein VMU95_03950 [Trebonia sp.]|nr:hypothetical protein [Trebonia sp.]
MRSWLIRMFRGRRLDRNPLRRRSDRAESAIGIALMVAFAVAAPFTVRAVAVAAYSSAEQARASALATRQEVTAVTLQAAPSKGEAQAWANAAWTAPDGRRRTGQVQVDDGTLKGSAERIWVTWPGDQAPPPLPAREVSQLAVVAGVGSGLGLAVFLLIAARAARQVLNRRRLAAWDAEWTAVEPRWNHQRW